MSGFTLANKVEAAGMALLLPYLEETADGRVVVTNKGVLARYVQREIGDAILNDRAGRMWSVEIKVERHHTGNLFLEVWSNKNLADPHSHAERGSTMGWLYHSRADLLFYYFLDTDDLYIIRLFELKRWAFGSDDKCGRIYAFRESRQKEYDQLNDTHGRIVPVSVIAEEIGLKHVKVRQLELWAREAA